MSTEVNEDAVKALEHILDAFRSGRFNVLTVTAAGRDESTVLCSGTEGREFHVKGSLQYLSEKISDDLREVEQDAKGDIH